MQGSLALVEIAGWSPAMVILDAMEKCASVRIVQAELNDNPGVCLKVAGTLGDVESAIQAAGRLADEMQIGIVSSILQAPAEDAIPAWYAKPDYNPLIEQPTVHIPPAVTLEEEFPLSQQAPFAIGFIETQGFTAVFEAIDTAVKTAAVEVVAREKLGGGYITVVIKGDVAAVRSAIEAGQAKVEGLGRLIAAHVIPSPSESALSLLPKL